MSKLDKLVGFEEPPRVPAVKPNDLKFALPADPLLSEKGLEELSVMEEMKVIGVAKELLGMDRPASPSPEAFDEELRPMEMFLPSWAVNVRPLPLLDAVTPVVPVLLLNKLTTFERVDLEVRFAVMVWPFK